MNTALAFLKRHALITFFVLSYAITWGLFALWDPNGDSIPLFSFGPMIAALLVTALTEGWPAVKRLLAKLVQWRVGWRWYAVAFGLPPLVILTAVGLATLSGAPAPSAAQWAGWPVLLELFIFRTIFSGPFGEELGWRGYALPRLQANFSPLVATLILNTLGIVWHLPLFFVDNITWPVVVTIMAGWLVVNWLCNATHGSVLLAMLIHGALNALSAFVGSMYIGANAVRLNLWEAIAWTAVALIIIVATRGNLGWQGGTRKEEDQTSVGLIGNQLEIAQS